jgi:sugar lactone lactonase YvrE
MRILLLITLLFLAVGKSAAQLPDIFADTPKQILATETIAEFPVNTFLENIAVDKKGNLFVTSLEDGKIYKISSAGKTMEFAQIKGKIAGIAFERSGKMLLTGWADGKTPSVFRVDKKGKVEILATIDGAIFLNGITLLEGDKFLIADSYRGAIWEFDAKNKSYRIWLEDKLLSRGNDKNPFPGVNGIKRFGNAIYVTNTEKQTLLKIAFGKHGKPETPVVIAEKINGDDFAMDADGNFYVTTHVYNSIVKVSSKANVTIIAENGNVIGSTALAFGRGKKDKKTIYVVTNGGMSLPPKDGVQKAKVVKLKP